MPPELLAGVCWIEVGGDPNFIDRVAFEVRSFDWSGPDWVDRNLTITNNPVKTSFGPVSIQLRTAAQAMRLNPSEMSTAQLRSLASCLQKDVFNIEIVARHLQMKTIVRLSSHVLFAFGLFVFIATPSNKYSWMKDMDPLIATLPVDDGSGSRTIFTLLLLTAIVVTQMGIVFYR